MTESRARHVCLLIVAIEWLLICLTYGLVLVGMSWDLIFSASGPPFELWAGAGMVLLVGACVVVGAFRRVPFHILAVLSGCWGAVATLATFTRPSLFEVVIVLLVLAPYLMYYVVRVRLRMRRVGHNGSV
ncbi:MAG: hypothetical protein LBV00_12025 [Propionibacteriaceae bacterium]|jgi:hypothetical protein|nr:hypothetical protein [Propionibacteriaceae bacterium]